MHAVFRSGYLRFPRRAFQLALPGIGAVPIVDAEGRVVGMYSRSDITFLATAADPEAVLQVPRNIASSCPRSYFVVWVAWSLGPSMACHLSFSMLAMSHVVLP